MNTAHMQLKKFNQDLNSMNHTYQDYITKSYKCNNNSINSCNFFATRQIHYYDNYCQCNSELMPIFH